MAKDAHSNAAIVYGAGLGGLHALDDFVDPAEGWELQQANGINSHGAIVGMATHQGRRSDSSSPSRSARAEARRAQRTIS